MATGAALWLHWRTAGHWFGRWLLPLPKRPPPAATPSPVVYVDGFVVMCWA
jgi:hypothetical protein